MCDLPLADRKVCTLEIGHEGACEWGLTRRLPFGIRCHQSTAAIETHSAPAEAEEIPGEDPDVA